VAEPPLTSSEADTSLQSPRSTYRRQRGLNKLSRGRQYLLIVRHRPFQGPPPPDAGSKMANDNRFHVRKTSASSFLFNASFSVALVLGAVGVAC